MSALQTPALLRVRRLGTVALALALAACAHPISITPNAAALQDPNAKPIPVKVGYYISAEDRDKEFVTPGGGGDKISHHPYREMESGFYRVLSNVFSDVTVLKAQNDTAFIHANSLRYVFVPTIVPTSSSEGVFTWPATDFTVDLTCTAYDADGKQVNVTHVTGSGKATLSEMKGNYGKSGQQASTEALLKLQAALRAAPQFQP